MRGSLGTGRGTEKRREAWRWTERAAPQAVWAFMSLPPALHLRAPPSPLAKPGRPGLSHHFLFFSFASLASSASWSLLSFSLFWPSGVLKYQSWVGGRGGG